MNQDNFNIEIRQFPKKVGVTSQREITNIINQAISEKKREITNIINQAISEKKREITNIINQAISEKTLTGHETLKVKTKLTLLNLDYELEISGDIALDVDDKINERASRYVRPPYLIEECD